MLNLDPLLQVLAELHLGKSPLDPYMGICWNAAKMSGANPAESAVCYSVIGYTVLAAGLDPAYPLRLHDAAGGSRSKWASGVRRELCGWLLFEIVRQNHLGRFDHLRVD